MTGTIYYAIGDIHGEAALLADLHARISKDARGKPACIVHLGDMIDRGPDSRGVIDQIMALQANPPSGIEVLALKGNHEQLMLDALATEKLSILNRWVMNGGEETLASYGVPLAPVPADWRAHIPSEHVAWLRARPADYFDEERRIFFVHAGIDPFAFPQCDEALRLWTRSDVFFNAEAWPDRAELAGLTVVHGHSALDVPVPEIQARRINVDTGVCYGGPLSAVKLVPGREVEILQAYRRRSAKRVAAGSHGE